MSCRPPDLIGADEFQAEYSLASCSPASLASASSANLMLQPTTFVRRANLSERPGNFFSVSLEGVTAVPTEFGVNCVEDRWPKSTQVNVSPRGSPTAGEASPGSRGRLCGSPA
jgi:hypothetical protein